MLPQTPPMAEGDLAQTPFAHLAVYLLDRRLTGELFVVEPETEVTHALRFERGMPVKVRMGDGYARLGELLVEEELVTADVVEGAVLTGGLLGDVLVLSGKVESAQLEEVLDRQYFCCVHFVTNKFFLRIKKNEESRREKVNEWYVQK
jgi:hypothetical protein